MPVLRRLGPGQTLNPLFLDDNRLLHIAQEFLNVTLGEWLLLHFNRPPETLRIQFLVRFLFKDRVEQAVHPDGFLVQVFVLVGPPALGFARHSRLGEGAALRNLVLEAATLVE